MDFSDVPATIERLSGDQYLAWAEEQAWINRDWKKEAEEAERKAFDDESTMFNG